MNSFELTEKVIPRGTPVRALDDMLRMLPAGFKKGDMDGKRELAVEQANREIAAGASGMRKDLYNLQAAVYELSHVECPLQHIFAPGAVARTIFLPERAVIVGKIHKHAHLNMLHRGKVTVVTEGGGIEMLDATRFPLIMVSPAGTKRAVHALEDTIWTTVHLTNETDLAKIEEDVIAKTYEEYEKFLEASK